MKNAGELSALAGANQQQGTPFSLVLGTLRKQGPATATSGLEPKSSSDRGGGFQSFLNAAGFFRTQSKGSEPVSTLPPTQSNPKMPELASHQNPRARRHSTAPSAPQKPLHQVAAAAAMEPIPIPLVVSHEEKVMPHPAAIETRFKSPQCSAAAADAHLSIFQGDRLPEGGSKTPEARREIGLVRRLDLPESVHTITTDWIAPSPSQAAGGGLAAALVQKPERFSSPSRADISEKTVATQRSENRPRGIQVDIDAVGAAMPRQRERLSISSEPASIDLVDENLGDLTSVARPRQAEGFHPIQDEANARKSSRVVEEPHPGVVSLPRPQSTDHRAPSVEPTAHSALPTPDAQIADPRHRVQGPSRPLGFESQAHPPERIPSGSIHPPVVSVSPGTSRGAPQETPLRIAFQAPTPDRTSLTKAASVDRGSSEVFKALEAEAPAASPLWTHTGTHKVEAGFQDPEVGWVRVRAQQDSDGVHAAVVPASSDASQILSSHLTGLNSYLAEHRTPIESCVLAPPESLPEAAGASQTGGGSTRQEPGRDANPGPPTDETARGASWAARDGPWAAEARQSFSASPVYEALGNGQYVSLLV